MRKLFEFVPGMHKAHPVRYGVIFLALVGFGLYCGFSKSIPLWPDGRTTVKAHFDRAANATTGNRVRVKGVDVGTITKIERDPSGTGALVTMKVKEDGFKVKRDAKAAIYWRTLLGRNMYVELDPGSASAPALGGQTIPMANTQSQIEFDELLDSYDERGRAGVRTFFNEFDSAFKGDAAGEAIERVAPGLEPVAPAMSAFRGTAPGSDIPRLVRTAATALDGLSRHEEALAGILDGADITFGVTAARRSDIAAMLQKAPQTMRDTRTTLARLNRTLDVMDPVARDLRPGVRRLSAAARAGRGALAQVSALTPDAIPALRDLRPALVRLRALSDQGTPLLRALRPTLTEAKDNALPALEKQDPEIGLKSYQAIGPFFSSLADSSAGFDAYGHFQRFQAGQGERSLAFLPCKSNFFSPASDEQQVSCDQFMELLPKILRGGAAGGGATAAASKAGAR